MRILIVGSGIAGLTLAALLRQRGQQFDLIERLDNFDNTGYMLGLYPMGSRVLYGLGLHDRFVAESQPTAEYSLWNSKGRHIRDYSFSMFTDRYGPLQTTSRGALADVLRAGLRDHPIRMGCSVERIEQTPNEVRVQFTDGSEAAYHLVVGADGMHSRTREHLFGPVALKRTGWGGWVFWIDGGGMPPATIAEYWGSKCMVGMYPTRDRIGCFVGGPEDLVKPLDVAGVKQHVRTRFPQIDGPLQALMDGLSDQHEAFYWPMADVRAPGWVDGRVVLVGDAAVGFLPTAGVGASMAMESAAALNDELTRVDAGFLPNALDLFVKRRKRRVESVQDNSRSLGKLMFANSRAVTAGRDLLMRFYTLEMALKDIVRSMTEPI